MNTTPTMTAEAALAAIDRANDLLSQQHPIHAADLTALRAHLTALEARCEALEANDARYRFLRVRLTGGEARAFMYHRPDESAAAAVDAAIDRARGMQDE